jgi:signal transduction histidine kinase
MADSEDRGLSSVASAWLVFAALAAVVGLSLVSLGVDLAIGRQTADRTARLVDDSLRSVALADDLRYQAHRLSAARLDLSQLLEIAKQIAVDAHDYDPIANGPGERAEWSSLQRMFDRLQQDRDDSTQIVPLVAGIERSIDKLVNINQRAAHDNQEAIADLHERGLIADVVIGAVTLVLAIGIGLVLLRSLRRQREMARRHLKAIDERNHELEAFAGRVAHDLRGPIAPVVGYTDLLLEPGADVPAIAARIRRATDRMASLIDDLLALSVAGRLPAGRGEVGAVVREVLDDLSQDLRDAEVKLAIPDTATAACAPGVLAQLVRNVVTNAIKYRGTGRKLQVNIDGQNVRGRIELTVTDNGVGMTREAVSHAFDPFYRATATRGIPGHGLGLAIVKRTVDAMGGDCQLASAPNEGTRVTLHLPAA